MSAPQCIAVFRARGLGDLLCAVPTLRALRRGWPHARVTLIGLPWARELAARFPVYVDEFVEFPGFPGLAERRREPQAVLDFLRGAQERCFDLALQLHDSGEVSNPLVALLGARRTAGYFREGHYCPDPAGFLPWRDDDPDVERGLRLLAALGVASNGPDLEAPVLRADLRELAAVADEAELPRGSYVCVHPGAQLESRRWYPERFAVVADALAARGLRVVVTGTGGEAAFARRVMERMRAPAVDLVGRTTLGGLTALVDGARLVVTNDTGVRHVAAARGTPCVAVACGSDVRRWPASGAEQRLLHAEVPCRPCVHDRCPVGHGCANSVESREVLAAADELLASRGH
ncbi:MAG TPA: glycosyltransferase family 9 protein [Gammaproteobacteria bacterium]|nr:glycosyltransferase family 9 protein [Gammaproteobacteria bacterium]